MARYEYARHEGVVYRRRSNTNGTVIEHGHAVGHSRQWVMVAISAGPTGDGIRPGDEPLTWHRSMAERALTEEA